MMILSPGSNGTRNDDLPINHENADNCVPILVNGPDSTFVVSWWSFLRSNVIKCNFTKMPIFRAILPFWGIKIARTNFWYQMDLPMRTSLGQDRLILQMRVLPKLSDVVKRLILPLGWNWILWISLLSFLENPWFRKNEYLVLIVVFKVANILGTFQKSFDTNWHLWHPKLGFSRK